MVSLPVMQKKIVFDLMLGNLGKAAVARKYGLSIYALEKLCCKSVESIWKGHGKNSGFLRIGGCICACIRS